MTCQVPPSNLLSTDRAASLRLALAMAEEARLVGQRIKQLREAQDLTQRELANEIPGSTQGSDISRWERGLHLPNSSTREHIAKALGVHIGDLYRESKDSPAPDLMDQLADNGRSELRAIRQRLDAIEDRIGELAGAVAELAQAVGVQVPSPGKQKKPVKRQTGS